MSHYQTFRNKIGHRCALLPCNDCGIVRSVIIIKGDKPAHLLCRSCACKKRWVDLSPEDKERHLKKSFHSEMSCKKIRITKKTLEFREKQSATLKQSYSDPEHKKNLLVNVAKAAEANKVRVRPNEERISRKKKLQEFWKSSKSLEARAEISKASKAFWKSPESKKCRENIVKSIIAFHSSPAGKIYKIAARERVIRTIQMAAMRPNKSEALLGSILDTYFPNEWKYSGNGSVVIEGRLPDFVNVNGEKSVIELFGTYWHDPVVFPNRPNETELIEHYRKYGFGCLVIWEGELKNVDNVVEKVKIWKEGR